MIKNTISLMLWLCGVTVMDLPYTPRNVIGCMLIMVAGALVAFEMPKSKEKMENAHD